jgi:chemotaxis protein CheC
MMNMSEIERGAVTDLLNVAVGNAAAALNDMVREEVRLSVPFIHFLDSRQAAARLEDEAHRNHSIAVKQQFRGPFFGEVMLIFPERKSLDLVRLIMGDAVPLDSMTELEQEALLEVGNVILNACLGSIAKQVGERIESSLPIYVRGTGEKILSAGGGGGPGDIVMFLHVDFALDKRRIYGYVAFVMDVESSQSFKARLRHLVEAAGKG